MDNIVNYAKTFFKTFDQSPFNEVDSAILSWLSYLKYPEDFSSWEGKLPNELYRAEIFDKLTHNVLSKQKTLELLAAVVASPRFRGLKILGYESEFDEDSDKQFAAVTYQLTPMLNYIAFRGTDSTFVGWKEDFNLSLEGPIPSQTAAVKYIENAAVMIKGAFIAGGHSKGGNLAVYSSSECSERVQKRILSVYSHDGPGFKPEFMERSGFKRIQSKINKTLPQSSLIGMIFESECEYRIVKSRDIGLGQHNLFTWCVCDGEFCCAEKLTPDAKLLYRSLNKWLSGLDIDEREKLIKAVFEILNETKASDFYELGKNPKVNVSIIAKAIANLDMPTKLFFLKLMSQFAATSAKSIYEAIENNIKPNNLAIADSNNQ